MPVIWPWPPGAMLSLKIEPGCGSNNWCAGIDPPTDIVETVNTPQLPSVPKVVIELEGLTCSRLSNLRYRGVLCGGMYTACAEAENAIPKIAASSGLDTFIS